MDDDLQRAKEDEINAATFSFDISRLKEDVAFSGNTVVTVIKAHLYLEHVIMQTLTEAFAVCLLSGAEHSGSDFFQQPVSGDQA